MDHKTYFPVDSNGMLAIKRMGIPTDGDLYHSLMKMTWRQFFIFFSLTYFVINSIFAFLYYMGGDVILNAEPGSYWDAFIFSFQTSSTIGYGHFVPKTNYAHFIVMLDTISGILFVAIATGIAFGKFSRATARVLFSKNLLINTTNGKRTLLLRMGNARSNQIVDANVNAVMTKPEVTFEGESIRRIYDLNLVRKNSPLFSLNWTVMHIIDEQSPLYNMTEEEILSGKTIYIISLSGVDDVFSQLVYDRHVYFGTDIKKDKRFDDVMRVSESGETYIDYTRFHDVH